MYLKDLQEEDFEIAAKVKQIAFYVFLPSSAQAQAQLEADLALFLLDPAPTPTRESIFGSLQAPSCITTSKVGLYSKWLVLAGQV